MEHNNDLKAKMFSKWLIDDLKLSTATARGYSSAINTASPYAREICGNENSIYDIDDITDLKKLLKELMDSDKFKEVNEHSHNRFKGAFDKYLQYKETLGGDMEYVCPLKKDDAGSFEKIEEIIKAADVDGISASSISNKIGKSIWLVNKFLKDKEYVIEVPGNIYIHADNVIDLFENKENIKKIIINQFHKFYGYTNDVVLFDAVSISMCMFLNDNCIDTPEKIYAIARYLFEKVENLFFFSGDKHIWENKPKYSLTYAGVLMSYIDKNGGRANRVQCSEYLQKVKLASTNINGILSVANSKEILMSANDEYVLADYIIEDESWIEKVKRAVEKLFENTAYIVPREISDNWFELLPALYGRLKWNLLLFQEFVKKYLPEYRLITANENQGLDTIRAGIVQEDSVICNFADLVYARLLEDPSVKLPVKMYKEDFRRLLIEYKMIQGNELIYTMPKALESSKFAWSSDEDSVLILN